jgi:cytochrome c oxidase assembly factor CtaG
VIAAAPGIPSLAFGHWQQATPLDVLAALSLAIYVFAARRVRGWPLWRGLSFGAGLATLLLATQSGIDTYDDRLLSAHMVQHLLLLTVAPPLLLGGRPLLLALRALAPPRRRTLAAALARARPLSSPWVALPVFAVVVLASHLRFFFDATLTHPLLHDAEHLAYLFAGLLLFTPLLDADPLARGRLDGLGRVFYLLAAMPPMALIGAYLNRATSVVYPPYAAPAHVLGISAVLDERQAGAIMWVGAGVVLIAVGLWSALAAMVREERRLAAREQRELAPLPAERVRP